MLLGIAFFFVCAVVAVGEWYLYDHALWWHEKNRDPRNFPPPR
jgi:hypothetical protein